MITYQEYEKAVYDWLLAKNNLDSSFTFSTRLNGMKGSELDYFIGTEKSGYFGLTFCGFASAILNPCWCLFWVCNSL